MDDFGRAWILRNAIEICSEYSFGVLTIRGLHYRLVSRGMTNSQIHYNRVKSAMTFARWEGLIEFEQFSDNERDVLGATFYEEKSLQQEIDYGKRQILAWMNNFDRNRWENQQFIPEVWIEKKALQGVFQTPCNEKQVALAPCKGYPSLTFLKEAAERFEQVIQNGQTPVIIYFGDYDPSGEDIPRSLEENLNKMGVYELEVHRISLLKDQVIEWGLPPAPAKKGDSRTASWDGLGQVELDAVEPRKLQNLCRDAIDSFFDKDIYEQVLDQEKEDLEEYKLQLKQYVNKLD